MVKEAAFKKIEETYREIADEYQISERICANDEYEWKAFKQDLQNQFNKTLSEIIMDWVSLESQRMLVFSKKIFQK